MSYLVDIQVCFQNMDFKVDIAKINAFQMWYYRRMLNICWMQKKPIKWILKIIKKTCLINKIRKSKMYVFAAFNLRK